MNDIENLRKVSLQNKELINSAKIWSKEKLDLWYKKEFLPYCHEMARFGLSRASLTSILSSKGWYDITQILHFLTEKGFKSDYYGDINITWG